MIRAEVRTYKTIEPPLLSKDSAHQEIVFAVERTIDLGIGTHHGCGMSHLDRGFKCGQVNLPHRPLVNFFVDGRAVCLLVVSDVVFNVSQHPLALYALDDRNAQLACKKGILPVALEGASVLRHTGNVDGWRLKE